MHDWEEVIWCGGGVYIIFIFGEICVIFSILHIFLGNCHEFVAITPIDTENDRFDIKITEKRESTNAMKFKQKPLDTWNLWWVCINPITCPNSCRITRGVQQLSSLWVLSDTYDFKKYFLSGGDSVGLILQWYNTNICYEKGEKW